jgi:hypothetical protein
MKRIVLLLTLCLAALSISSADEHEPAPEPDVSVLELLRKTRNSTPMMGQTIDAQGYCCKVCTTGKACGDTCIARDKVCHVGPGCACDR